MPRTNAPKPTPTAPVTPQWSPEELMKVRHLGPGIIGQAKYDAAQAYVHATNGGKFGPALLGIGYHGGPTAEEFKAMQAQQAQAKAAPPAVSPPA